MFLGVNEMLKRHVQPTRRFASVSIVRVAVLRLYCTLGIWNRAFTFVPIQSHSFLCTANDFACTESDEFLYDKKLREGREKCCECEKGEEGKFYCTYRDIYIYIGIAQYVT